MKKFFRFLSFFLFFSIVIIAILISINLTKQKDSFKLATLILENYLVFIPVISSISLLWGLVIKTKKDFEHPVSSIGVSFSVFIYIFFTLAFAFFIQEIIIPKLMVKKTDFIKLDFLNKDKKTPEKVSYTISNKELQSLTKLPKKENIAFMMGENLFVYFKKMYKGEYYYVEDLTIVGYSKKKDVSLIISAKYAKIVDENIYPLAATLVDFSKGTAKANNMTAKKIPVNYNPEAIYLFASDEEIDRVSLVDVFRFSDFLFASKIHYLRLGNMVFNQLIYYIIIFILLIFASIFGGKYGMIKPLQKEFFEFGCFLLVSVVCTILAYDIMVAFARMIYELII
ncbi:MAG: hypothetical protein N2258_03870 [Brevinematales bacterium]|nr:hypothetical protein [Brevinematales bacterium]